MMWARFNDSTGTIDEVLSRESNYIEGTLGTMPPWGDGYRAPWLIEAEGWRQVPDDWRPPKTAQQIKDEKNTAINAHYSGKLKRLQNAVVVLLGDGQPVMKHQEMIKALKVEWRDALKVANSVK